MVNLAGSSKLLRAMNLGAALDLLFQRGQLTRGELREATGLSKPTVSEAMRRLVDAGLAVVVGHVRGGPGPHAEIYAINAEAAYAAAVAVRDDVGGPWLSAALCDLTGTVRATVAHRLTGTDAVTALTSAVHALTAATGRTALPLAGVQLGVAGAFDPKTRTLHHVDLPGFDRPGLVDAVSSQVGAPVWVDNDVNLAAVAERRHGHGAAAHTFALMWLGEGLGLAIDLDGVILRGARGGAGEIGYMPVRDPERPMSPADLQAVLGGDAVRALAARYGHPADTLSSAAAAARTDPALRADLADRVVLGLAPVVAVLDPDLVVLAGPTATAGGEPLRDAVCAALRRAAPFEVTVKITCVDGDAVVLGGLDAALRAVRSRLLASVRAVSPAHGGEPAGLARP